jgi:23S rRNA (uracil1939-C5)-methyltransferase
MSIEIQITRMGLEGQGVGHDEAGNIYFVPGALTGDRVVVEPERTDKRYRDARLERVESPSPARISPECPHFQVCGGCDWLHWEYRAQLEAKDSILRHVLERGALTPERLEPMIPAPKIFGYRNRIQVRQLGSRVGFYKRGSHDIVDIEHCPVAHPKLSEAIAELKKTPTDRVRKAELFVDSSGNLGSLFDVPHGAGGFTQINPEQNEKLKDLVASALKESGSRHVVELYAGNGNLTFAYLPNVDTAYAVDSSKTAILRARETAQGLTNVTFAVGSAEAHAVKLPQDVKERCDTLVLDPPRTGMVGGLEAFLHDGVKTVVYVSCSPVAFAKDVQCLKKNFTFRRVQPIDMFPHTRHIEFVALFTRSSH